jgi:tetratricopeptide repeat protein
MYARDRPAGPGRPIPSQVAEDQSAEWRPRSVGPEPGPSLVCGTRRNEGQPRIITDTPQAIRGPFCQVDRRTWFAAAGSHAHGDLLGSREHLERAQDILRAAQGPNHTWLGTTLAALGRVLRDQGDLPDARVQLERAHCIFRAALGPEHTDTQAVASELARL